MPLWLLGGWKWVVDLFSNPKYLLYLGAAILVAFMLWKGYNFVDNALENTRVIEQQKIELQLQDNEINTLKAIREQAIKAEELAAEARAEAEESERALEELRRRILESGDENDGLLAPVLQDTLRDIRNR